MSDPSRRHRLDGLEPDNLLAFLALLGLLGALDACRPDWFSRAAWDLNRPPLRPFLTVAEAVTREMICEAGAQGIASLVAGIEFGSAADLKLEASEARKLLSRASAEQEETYLAALCAALMSDAALDQEMARIEPTPLAYPTVATSNFLRSFLALSKAELRRSGAAILLIRGTLRPVSRKHCSSLGSASTDRSDCGGTPTRRSGMPISGGRQPRTLRPPNTAPIGWP